MNCRLCTSYMNLKQAYEAGSRSARGALDNLDSMVDPDLMGVCSYRHGGYTFEEQRPNAWWLSEAESDLYPRSCHMYVTKVSHELDWRMK